METELGTFKKSKEVATHSKEKKPEENITVFVKKPLGKTWKQNIQLLTVTNGRSYMYKISSS